ncbi:TIGR03620 family F420-dependent LLM class oxidoreductase [Ruania zhangjianzhongii]|uniref:TIGR03620 family F420-dependent LLM class oxidoreductase n=1 Tax=Ruania zhangjianzhongii TaxID=2603206 RepID=UPI0011C96553|nr:TIGR03620 family F420-dependent LLM class oxidoreductase [Ruania zhangjianzhongii]
MTTTQPSPAHLDRTSIGPLGASLQLAEDGSHLKQALELERLGYSALWLAGGQLATLAPIDEILRATNTIRVGTAIIPLDVHDHAAVLAAHEEIQQEHPGRFVVGLGAPQQGPRPMASMDAFLDQVEAADRPIPRERRLLAALGPRKLTMARDRFGGAITLLVTPEFTARARQRLGSDRILVVDEMLVLDTDAERARAAARELLGFLLQVPGYRQNALRMGFSDTEVDTLDDRLVDALVGRGGPDALAQRVVAQHAAGADHVVVNLLDTDASEPFLHRAAALAERLLR